MLAFFAIIFGIVFLDQLSKWLAVIFLKGEESFYIINKLLRFSYVENRGAAFGMLADSRWVFLIISTVMIIAITGYVFKERPKNKWAYTACAFIVGGGIGNMIDRIVLGYVIDFIDFYTIWSFVFNIADSFVCVGAVILMIYLIVSMIIEEREAKLARETAAENDNKNEETADD